MIMKEILIGIIKMICYKDKTWCPFWNDCKNGLTCDRALTTETRLAANKWWGTQEAPMCIYGAFPDCFIKKGGTNE